MPNFSPQSLPRISKGTFSLVCTIHQIKCDIVGTFDSKNTLPISNPNEFVLRKIITDWDVENRISFKRQENGLNKISPLTSKVMINKSQHHREIIHITRRETTLYVVGVGSHLSFHIWINFPLPTLHRESPLTTSSPCIMVLQA